MNAVVEWLDILLRILEGLRFKYDIIYPDSFYRFPRTIAEKWD